MSSGDHHSRVSSGAQASTSSTTASPRKASTDRRHSPAAAAPSSPSRTRSDFPHPAPPSSATVRSPTSPRTQTSTTAGVPSPQRASLAAANERSQNTSASSSPYASLSGAPSGGYDARGQVYPYSIRSSAASSISSTSGEEEDDPGTPGGRRDARSAAAASAPSGPPPPASYAQATARNTATATPRQPSITRMSTHLGPGAPPGPSARQRSASRGARPVVKRHHTAASVQGEDDDEVHVLDRGEELVRRRNKERRAHAAALGRGQSFLGDPATAGGGGGESRRTSRSKTPRDRDSMFSQQGAQALSAGYGSLKQPPTSAGAGAYGEGGSSSLRDISRDRTSVSGINAEREASDAGSVAGEQLGQSWQGSTRGDEGEGEELLADGDERDMEDGSDGADLEDDEDDDDDDEEDVELTLRDRQDAINIEHPFGLPIWKPALYKKSRTVTRQADSALHSTPSLAAQRHLLPGNIAWTVLFGWWLAAVCLLISAFLWCVEGGGRGRYAIVVAGLGWYIFWPFGKYVEGEGLRGAKPAEREAHERSHANDDEAEPGDGRAYQGPEGSAGSDSEGTVRGSPGPGAEAADRVMPLPTDSIFKEGEEDDDDDGGSHTTIRHSPPTERDSLLRSPLAVKRVSVALPGKRTSPKGKGRADSNVYGSFESSSKDLADEEAGGSVGRTAPTVWLLLGRLAFWPLFAVVLAPLMFVVCILCWGGVISIPMARLLWALLKLLSSRPLELGFKPAPSVVVSPPLPDSEADSQETAAAYAKSERLRAGQVAPTGGRPTTVLLCTYKAVGSQYYKYTIGGVNILFVNLLPLVFFVIFDAFVLLKLAEKHDLGPVFNFVANRAVIFVLSLSSVIPLSYFIGMAVASISAQSSIGMGAVINATFGSIIEIILYSIALTQGKGRLVEGSLVGSLLAGVLVMPGMSMLSGAFRRKEQSFNAKSAGVTSTMLIMAILGILIPTVFYKAYGSVELSCTGCPDGLPGEHNPGNQPWMCHSCRYVHPDPAQDPFYQDKVKNIMYISASLLLLSYLIGLWFSLRTHASQIWQNPQQILQQPELITSAHAVHPAHRASVYNRVTPAALAHAAGGTKQILPTHASASTATARPCSPAPQQAPDISRRGSAASVLPQPGMSSSVASLGSASGAAALAPPPGSLTPFVEGIVRRDVRNMPHLDLNDSTAGDDYFTKAVTAATVTALRHQQVISSAAASKIRLQAAPAAHVAQHHEGDGHGGHEGPSWDRKTSASVLLACTALYAIIAEILVDVVDVILDGSGIDEKFLGITLFALVPNTTEFMNAMSFALNGNIALSMEIGSAYALQVCLLQIPAMVAFSAIYDPVKMGEYVDTFTLILPQFDCISIMFSIFLITYTYIEARANYHRGSILILAYLVLLAGFYYAPGQEVDEERWPIGGEGLMSTLSTAKVDPLPFAMNLAAHIRGFFA